MEAKHYITIVVVLNIDSDSSSKLHYPLRVGISRAHTCISQQMAVSLKLGKCSTLHPHQGINMLETGK